MTALAPLLLVVGVAAAVLRPFRLPSWPVALAGATAVVLLGWLPSDLQSSLGPLESPIAFLLAAVPLALLLERLGFFSAIAEAIVRAGRGSGALWLLASVVTTALNLDASVVLLTPLFVGVARRTGRDPLTLAFQPVLLACLASSALPVSNLTNLIAAGRTGAGTAAFMAHLALPSAVATGVGWLCYRRVLQPDRVFLEHAASGSTTPAGTGTFEPPSAAAGADVRFGAVVVTGVLLGFVAGRDAGIPPWQVAVAADAILVLRLRHIPWRAVPVGTAVLVCSLGLLVDAAFSRVDVTRLVGGTSTMALARTVLITGLGANVANNLPTLLVALHGVGNRPGPALWAVLLGTNMGPVLLVTGSLASLLWLDTMGRLGVRVNARTFGRIGVQVGVPAVVAGATALLGARAVGW